jgi:tRNA-Thr(GGU) m(6)t(6)A37 methyltransferase TsaA
VLPPVHLIFSGACNEKKINRIAIPKNKNIIKVIPIGTLVFSEHQAEAQQSIDFVVSDMGASIFHRHGIRTYPDPRITMITDHQRSEYMDSDQEKERIRRMEIVYRPIGIIHSEHTDQENTPIQGIFNPSVGTVEVFPEYAAGLKDIERFSHLILLYHFDRATGVNLVQKPFLDVEKERGIFAIRHFNRPNPIGFSIVDLLGVHGTTLEIRGVDVLDGTPLLDIKPYVRQFDHRNEVQSGWVDDQHMDDIAEWNATPKELRDRRRTNL